MIQYTVYVCETCGYECKSGEEMMEHEATHLGLTARELEAYRALRSFAAYKGYIVSNHKNKKTDEEYNDAISALLKFEKEHGIKTK